MKSRRASPSVNGLPASWDLRVLFQHVVSRVVRSTYLAPFFISGQEWDENSILWVSLNREEERDFWWKDENEGEKFRGKWQTSRSLSCRTGYQGRTNIWTTPVIAGEVQDKGLMRLESFVSSHFLRKWITLTCIPETESSEQWPVGMAEFTLPHPPLGLSRRHLIFKNGLRREAEMVPMESPQATTAWSFCWSELNTSSRGSVWRNQFRIVEKNGYFVA